MTKTLVGGEANSQIREQMSGPDLHVFTLKFLALKNPFFHFFGVNFFLNFFENTVVSVLKSCIKKVKNFEICLFFDFFFTF